MTDDMPPQLDLHDDTAVRDVDASLVLFFLTGVQYVPVGAVIESPVNDRTLYKVLGHHLSFVGGKYSLSLVVEQVH